MLIKGFVRKSLKLIIKLIMSKLCWEGPCNMGPSYLFCMLVSETFDTLKGNVYYYTRRLFISYKYSDICASFSPLSVLY